MGLGGGIEGTLSNFSVYQKPFLNKKFIGIKKKKPIRRRKEGGKKERERTIDKINMS